MEYKTIEEVYTANAAIRKKLKQTIGSLSARQLTHLPEDEKWTVTQLVEHVAIVNGGMSRICAKLLSKAEAAGLASDGSCTISNAFTEAGRSAVNTKFQAPEMVHPVNNLSIEDSFAKLDEAAAAFENLKEKFSKFDGAEAKFPHPYFGDLSAQEWLVLAGGHEARHISQIRKLAEKIG